MWHDYTEITIWLNRNIIKVVLINSIFMMLFVGYLLSGIHNQESHSHLNIVNVIKQSFINTETFNGHVDDNNRFNYLSTQGKNEECAESTSYPVRTCSQSIRKIHLNNMCHKYNITGTANRGPTTQYVVDSVNKVAYCFIQKCGCTTWKTMMAKLATNGSVELNQRIHAQYYTKLKKYGLEYKWYTPSEVKVELTGYTKFIVVRNPFHRLVSAYNDKVVRSTYAAKYFRMYLNWINEHNQSNNHKSNKERRMNNETDPSKLKDFQESIYQIKLHHPNTESNDLPKSINREISQHYPPTFNTFIEMVVSANSASNDKHWNNYFGRSSICFVQYDYILKLETMDIDLPMFLSEVYPNSNDSNKMKGVRNGHTTQYDLNNACSKRRKLFKSLGVELLTKLIAKFKYEALFFGYDFDFDDYDGTCSIQQSLDKRKYSTDKCC